MQHIDRRDDEVRFLFLEIFVNVCSDIQLFLSQISIRQIKQNLIVLGERGCWQLINLTGGNLHLSEASFPLILVLYKIN